MRVIISAGGTGGHIYPALAIINKIKEEEPNSEFLYIGTHNRMEKDIIPKHNINFVPIRIYGINKKNIFKIIRALFCFIFSIYKCKKIIKKFNPDVVVGVGGYVTGPVIYSAKKLGYKTFIHEQNSISGKANKFLAKYTDVIGVSFDSTLKEFKNAVYTGNPRNEEVLSYKKISKEEIGMDNNKKLVLIVMGSLGSSKITDFLVNTVSLFNNKNYQVLIITGNDSYSKFENIKIPSNVKILSYLDNMPSVMKSVDLIISRAGATTISEILALNIPSILIPSPYVANNHQYINADYLFKKQASLLIEEKELTSELLIKTIDNIINDEVKLNEIKHNLALSSVNDSSSRIYKILKNLGETNEKTR